MPPQPAPHPPADAVPSLSPLPRGEGIARSPRSRGEGRGERQVSVMIPTLNSADTLPRLMKQISASTLVSETVVVDGGSSDETVAIAGEAGAQVVAAPCGRGIQLAAGTGVAAGAWFLFLHADCRL